MQRILKSHDYGRKITMWKPKEDGESVKEVNSIRSWAESSKIEMDVSIGFGNIGGWGKITVFSESLFSPSTLWEPMLIRLGSK